jgi:methylmalonyl-CoA mutase
MPAKMPTSAAEPLLGDFGPVTRDAWRKVVETELKGDPFEKRMLTRTIDGLTLQPIYRREDAERLTHTQALPGFPPFVRGTSAAGYRARPWEVSQEITASSPADFNDQARAGLERGLTALNMVLDKATRNGADPDWAEPLEVGAGGLSVYSLNELGRALDGIDLERVPLFIRSGASGMPVAALLVALARRRGKEPARLCGCIETDPLGVLAHEGRLPQSMAGAYREMAALTSWAAVHAPRLQTICVHSRPWHEAGGSAVHELGFALATALDYLREMNARGLGVDLVAPRVRLACTVGTQFFTEIAKLRAMRALWSHLISALGGGERAQQARLHVRTSLFNKTVYDPYVNVLRTTVEAFAGVLGGCDSLQVGRFDEVLRPPGEFSQRLARNQQLVLRDECHLTEVIDPAGGSWFIETLTDELARRAWALFQEVERQGGMTRALRAGFPQKEVSKVAAERLDRIAQRRDTLVGTNQYADPTETAAPEAPPDMAAFHRRRVQQVTATRTAADDGEHHVVLERLAQVVGREKEALFAAAIEAGAAGATLGEVTRAIRIEDRPDEPLVPVCLTRAAEGFERLRGAVDARRARTGRQPTVFLANMGPLKQHKARADFARGFLEVAGFRVISPAGFETPEAAIAAGLESGADAACVCSTDETYPALVPDVVRGWRARRPETVMILAGYPVDQVEGYRKSGIDEFIHIRANALDVLSAIARRLGVES